MEFHDREDELTALEERWRSQRAEFMVIYGRRRVGKSHLIARFAESRRSLVFEATAGTEQNHLEDISREIARLSGRAIYREQPLTSWRAAFAAFAELISEGPIVIAIDEFQFVARRNAEIGSLVNELVSTQQGNRNLFLILSGSDVSFFEQDVVGYAATSYGRRTGSLRLEPFDFARARLFVPHWAPEDQVRAWAVFGGMPYYLNEIDPSAGVSANILRAILRPDSLLRSEPELLLAQESRIRDRDVYMAILRAVASGATRLSEIAQRVGKRSDESRAFLETLEGMRLVRRVYPITKPRGNRVLYAISDPFLRFWFRFVAPFESRLQTREAAARHLEETVLPALDHFVSGDGFEEACQTWTLANHPGAAEVGRWWGNKKVRTPEGPRNRRFEADVVSVDAEGRVIGLGSCRWSDSPHDAGELDRLETIAGILGEEGLLAEGGVRLTFFDRTAFSPRLRQVVAERSDVRLVMVDDLARLSRPGPSTNRGPEVSRPPAPGSCRPARPG